MSRTDKTRPYWVKVNDHGVEHHDHSRLGEEVWRTRNVKDEGGNLVFEELPYYHSVGDLLARPESMYSWATAYALIPKRDEDGKEFRYWIWNRDYSVVTERGQNKMRSEAMWLRAHGYADSTLVKGGYYKRPKQERYLAYTIPNHCTIDEPHDEFGRANNWRGVGPCYMEADWQGEFRSMYRYRCSCCSPRGYNAAKRAVARDTLRTTAKAYNSGEEFWEDEFDRENITPRRKAGQSWW